MLRALNLPPSFHLFFPPVLALPLILLLKEWLLLMLRESERETMSGEVHVWELGERNSSSVERKSKTSKKTIQ